MSAHGWLVWTLAVGLCPVAACSGDENHSSSSPAFGEHHACPGAYTPNSDECWDRTRPTNPTILADRVESEFRGLGLGERCAVPVAAAPGTEGNLTITFTTLPLGRTQYGPRNCGAVWIENELEGYVRTLELWVKERQTSLTMWDLRRCQTDPTAADAITSPTLNTHVQHVIKWNGRDWRNNIVPDGKYTLWLQVTENEIVPEGPYIEIEWVKGAMSRKQEFMATNGFTAVQMDWQPGPSMPNKTVPDTPAAGAGGAPAGGMGAPMAGMAAPAAGTGAPMAGTAGPVAGTAAPNAGTAAPIAGAAAPIAGASAP